MSPTEGLIKMVPYFSSIHHSPGRLRVRIDAGIVRDAPGVSFAAVAELPERVDGLKQIKINKVMGTATILYDPRRLPPEAWEALLAGELRGPFADLANQLLTKESS